MSVTSTSKLADKHSYIQNCVFSGHKPIIRTRFTLEAASGSLEIEPQVGHKMGSCAVFLKIFLNYDVIYEPIPYGRDTELLVFNDKDHVEMYFMRHQYKVAAGRTTVKLARAAWGPYEPSEFLLENVKNYSSHDSGLGVVDSGRWENFKATHARHVAKDKSGLKRQVAALTEELAAAKDAEQNAQAALEETKDHHENKVRTEMMPYSLLAVELAMAIENCKNEKNANIRNEALAK